jgi:hypothetical protein
MGGIQIAMDGPLWLIAIQVYAILDEVFLAGEIEETSKQVVLTRLEHLDKLDWKQRQAFNVGTGKHFERVAWVLIWYQWELICTKTDLKYEFRDIADSSIHIRLES